MSEAPKPFNLEELAALIKSLPPRPRIIVGFPGVTPHGVVHRERDGLILIGEAAYQQLVNQAVRQLRSHDSPLQGVRVERFSFAKFEHRELADAVAIEMLTAPEESQ